MNFDAKDVEVTIELGIENVLFPQGEADEIEHSISYKKEVLCDSCNGTREAPSSESSKCYSCKGKGIRKDPLFGKESRCNTCKGFGTLVKTPCSQCKGTGLLEKTFKKVL